MPQGFIWGRFNNTANASIRYGHVKPEGETLGTLVILGGFREPAEKYFEVIRENVGQGFEVFTMDWRGQGGSDHYLPDEPMKSHHLGYDEQIATLHQFMQTIVVRDLSKPLVMVAHSMGAHIGLRYLNEHAGVFDAAILTAPMLNIGTDRKPPKPFVRLLSTLAVAAGCGTRYVPGGGPWSAAHESINMATKTSDAERGQVQNRAYLENPQLQMGDPTYGWVYHTFRSIKILNRTDYLKSINTPILMQISGDEHIVDRKAAERASRLLPQCKRVDFPTAKHEIWMERDELRTPWLQEINACFDGCIRGKALAAGQQETITEIENT
jgi:lysophospholipase